MTLNLLVARLRISQEIYHENKYDKAASFLPNSQIRPYNRVYHTHTDQTKPRSHTQEFQ